MKHLLFFGLLFLASSLFSQDKKTYFLNEKLTSISKEAFWDDENSCEATCNTLRLQYNLDTADFYVKVSRLHDGTISKDSLLLLKKDLELSSGSKIDSTNLIVIDFYPRKDECNSGGSSTRYKTKRYHEKYLKKLHSLAPVSQFSIYGKPEGLERYGGFKIWKPDLNSRVKNNFFPLDYPCGSVVVICPDGHFMSYFGEYSKELVWNLVKLLRPGKS